MFWGDLEWGFHDTTLTSYQNGLNIFTTKNRDILMKRISSIAASDTICDQILDIDTTISKGYTEISDDVEGDVLRSSLIKSI